MKSKRRHELQTNELADQLGVWIQKVRPHLVTGALILVALAAVVGVGYYWKSSKQMLVGQAWRSFMVAGTNPQSDAVDELNHVADTFSDTQAGLWAAQTAADIQAAQGVRMLFEDTTKANDYLNNAIDGYQQILANTLVKKSPMLQHRAEFGLAQTLESTGKLEEAIKHYQAVVDAAPKSAVGKVAQRHVDRLSRNSTQQWYAWFDQQVPAAPAAPGPGIGTSDLGPPSSNLETLSDSPGAGFMEDAVKPEAEAEAETGAEDAGGAAKEDAGAVASGPPLDSPVTPPATGEPAKTEPEKTEPANKQAEGDQQ